MIKKLLILTFIILISSCSSVKKTQEAINYGNYDQAIQIAVKELRENKTKKGNQEYVTMLEDAFEKAVLKDQEKITFLKKDGNSANFETIYNSYLNLKNRQELIKPLLPLTIQNKGKNAKFLFTDYTNDILASKTKLSDYLYTNAANLLKSSTSKYDYRKAFEDLNYLEKINPNYKNSRSLIEEAHFKGINFVYVSLENRSDKVIPMRLEADLLNFDTYKLNNLWTVYHTDKQLKTSYDYEIEVNFREINISPEQIKEKEIIKDKQVIDGWKYLVDKNGNTVKDSLGKAIKVDKFKTIRCKVSEIAQFKSVQVVGQVKYFDLVSNQLIKSFPLASEFIFEHRYATYSGDKNALEKEYLNLLTYKHMPFPSNEQMIYDTSEDLKNKIKYIVIQNKIEY